MRVKRYCNEKEFIKLENHISKACDYAEGLINVCSRRGNTQHEEAVKQILHLLQELDLYTIHIQRNINNLIIPFNEFINKIKNAEVPQDE